MILSNAHYLTPDGQFHDGAIIIENGRISKMQNAKIKNQKSNTDFSSSSSRITHHAPRSSTAPATATSSRSPLHALRSFRLRSTSVAELRPSLLDASGFLVLPGAIDTHVHFREPGQIYKEGVINGSKAALKGGVTTILDMPNNKPPCATLRRLEQKKELFRRKALVNWGLMLHASVGNDEKFHPAPVAAKIYMSKSSALPAITSIEHLTELFRRFPVLAIHAEDETAFDNSPTRSPLHHENRPRKAVVSALNKIEKALHSIAEKKRPRLVICHVNTAEEIDWLARLKQEGFDVWGETCPHYLYFTQDDYIKHGAAFQVNPPIRASEDRQRLRQGISEGIIDFIGTDHAPHSNHEKNSSKPPSGIAGAEWLIPLLLNLIDEGVIDWKRFHELTCGKAAECYGIKDRDGIMTGKYADLVLIDRTVNFKQDNWIQTKAGINLFGEINTDWNVRATIVNGVMKFNGRKFFNDIKGKEVEIESHQ